jgi:hypothetical protein
MYLNDILYLTKKIITLRAKFSHHNLQTPTSLYQIHMLDSRWIVDNNDIKQCLWVLRFSHPIDILFVFEMPCTQHNKSLHSIRWSPLTLEKIVQVFTSLLQKESWERKLSDVKRGRFKSLKRICHCTSVFAFGLFRDVKQTVHQTLLVVGIIKKTWWVWYKLWYVQNECSKELAQNDKWKHYHKKSLSFFSYGTICHICKLNLWMSG